MKEKHAKWLVGCGIGCAALVALVVAVGFGAFYAVRDVVRNFEQVNETVSDVDKRYGEARDYTPNPDGRIPPDRIRAFLAVRSRTRPTRDEFRQTMTDIEVASTGKGRGVGAGFRTVRSALGVPRLLGRLYSDRASALLENQMGFGEYLYIYSVAYYSFLRKDPGDGPENFKMSDDHTITIEGREAREAALETHREHAIGQVRTLFRRFLRNAVEPAAAAEAAPEAEALPERPPIGENLEWRQAVQKELDALDSKWDRIPWEDGLPKQIEESLAPYRAELEASYDPMLNLLEFAPSH